MEDRVILGRGSTGNLTDLNPIYKELEAGKITGRAILEDMAK